VKKTCGAKQTGWECKWVLEKGLRVGFDYVRPKKACDL